MRVLMSGGGTGGHLYPALAIAKGLLEKDPGIQLLFVGTMKGLEAQKVPQEGFELRTISVMGFPRRLSPELFKASFLAAKACTESRRIIKDFRPDVVVGTGGYVCGPVILTAALAGIPCVIQEQNTIPGVTNRVLARFARKVAVAFQDSVKFFPDPKRVVVTGNPVRPEIATIPKADGLKAFKLSPSRKTLLIFGGGQGAMSVNRALVSALPALLKKGNLQILHSTGKENYQKVKDSIMAIPGASEAMGKRQLVLEPYIDNMPYAYAAADLVVSRAGAMSLSEIAVRGLPAILIPFPYAANDHQAHNARVFQEQGAALVIGDHELTGESLWRAVSDLLDDKARLAMMAKRSKGLGKPLATMSLVDMVVALAH
jgi:UDP-N-acetylglucosamine--N-acetylmuramyl-(pentapeptide) pyrophosphoryl-undecaprenol N-acetylglucosamine transferase